jgi:hypothetical protein
MPKPPNSNFGWLQRPPVGAVAPKKRGTIILGVVMSPAERKIVTQASMRGQLTRSEWCRRVLLAAAKQDEAADSQK